MSSIHLRALVCAFFCMVWCAGAAHAQQPPQLSASLSSGIIKAGADLRLTISISGAQAAQLQELPKVDKLRFTSLGQPIQQQSITTVNGRRTVDARTTWVIRVEANEPGSYTIPPIEVKFGTTSLSTRALPLKVVADMQGEELGILELTAPKQVFAGQPFDIKITMGLDTALDIARMNYLNLSLPWLGQSQGMIELPVPAIAPADSAADININLESRQAAVRLPDLTKDGRTFLMLQFRRRFIATREGALEFPTSYFEFGVQNRDVFSRGEKQTYYKRYPAFAIDVEGLPETGKPFEFSGAVGTLSASARADRRSIKAGESIKLTVDWEGDGNLDFFEPPDLATLPEFSKFRIYGKTERKTFERRSVTYDLTTLSADTTEIPPVPLSVFDVERKAYTTLRTQPIPIQVRALAEGGGLTDPSQKIAMSLDLRDLQRTPYTGSSTRGPAAFVLFGTAGVVLCGWLSLRKAVRRRGDPSAPLARSRARALRALSKELGAATTAAAQAHALRRFLAARSGERPEAWAGRSAARWAKVQREAGGATLTDAAAHELDTLAEELDAQVWNGRDAALERARIEHVARELVGGGL